MRNKFLLVTGLSVLLLFSAVGAQAKELPRLVDLGADKCIPCKRMAPILEGLKVEYAGQMEVKFIDVWKAPEEAKKFRVQMIPTQIFYAEDGKELYRHMGFYSKDQILRKWRELGVVLKGTGEL